MLSTSDRASSLCVMRIAFWLPARAQPRERVDQWAPGNSEISVEMRRSGITHHFFSFSLHFVLISSSLRRNETAAPPFYVSWFVPECPLLNRSPPAWRPPIDTAKHHVELEPDEIPSIQLQQQWHASQSSLISVVYLKTLSVMMLSHDNVVMQAYRRMRAFGKSHVRTTLEALYRREEKLLIRPAVITARLRSQMSRGSMNPLCGSFSSYISLFLSIVNKK